MPTIVNDMDELREMFDLPPITERRQIATRGNKEVRPVAGTNGAGSRKPPATRVGASALPPFGEIYWLSNELLRFGDAARGGMHPAVVVERKGKSVVVYPMTSKMKINKRALMYRPEPGVQLNKHGEVLTQNRYRREVPEAALTHYLGTMGPEARERLHNNLITRSYERN